jgi:integrase
MNAPQLKKILKEGKPQELRIEAGPAGGGSLFLRIWTKKGGTASAWMHVWYEPGTGKRRKMALGSAGEGGLSLAGAKKAFYEQVEKIQAGIDPLDAKAQDKKANQTFHDFFTSTYYPNAKTYKKPDTYKHEEAHYKHYLAPIVGKMSFDKIKEFHVRKIKQLIEDLAPRTQQYVLATFRQIWNAALDADLAHGPCPARRVKIPKFDNKRQRSLTDSEAEQLLEALKEKDLQTYRIAFLSLYTGMRAGEIFKLRWEDLNLAKRIITIRDSKSGKTRHAFMTNDVHTMFQDMKNGHEGTAHVFLNANGTPWKKISPKFPDTVKALGLNANIEDSRHHVIFHTLRHTFASRLVSAGTNLYTVKELLGHSTITLTERYSHLSEDAMRAATDIFNGSKVSNGSN